MGEEWEQTSERLQSKLTRCVLVSGLALSPPQAPAKLGSSGPGSVLALSGRLTASSSPKVGALGKGVKSLRNACRLFLRQQGVKY